MEEDFKKSIADILKPLIFITGGVVLILSFFVTDPVSHGAAHSFLRLFIISITVLFILFWGITLNSFVITVPVAVFGMIIFAGTALASGLYLP